MGSVSKRNGGGKGSGFRLLAIGDSPTTNSGFGRVMKELLARWEDFFERIDVWGLSYNGHPHTFPYEIYPGKYSPSENWYDQGRMQALINLLLRKDLGYTHVWCIQDSWLMMLHGFPRALADVCEQRGIRSFYYFPVDAPLEARWTEMMRWVDCAVAYTEYGRKEARRFLGEDFPMEVIPHGVDTEAFYPLDELTTERPAQDGIGVVTRVRGLREVRKALRQECFIRPWLADDDILMVNVNQHQPRKDVTRSLEILAGLRAMAGGEKFKLLMHMAESDDGESLEEVGAALGLVRGKDWEHTGSTFVEGNPRLSEVDLNRFYNASNLYLTTTLGEGWGLGMTEALAAGCMVAAPRHTACEEIAGKVNGFGRGERMVLMRTEENYLVQRRDNSRLRQRVDVAAAVAQIFCLFDPANPQAEENSRHAELTDLQRSWLDWDRIAKEWRRLFYNRQRKGLTEKVEVNTLLAPPAKLYVEYQYGLGDVFNQMFLMGSYRRLCDLKPGEKAVIGLACHNPHVRELFEWHPKREQMEVRDYGYWDVKDDVKMRKELGLPKPDSWYRLPREEGQIFQDSVGDEVFYPSPVDMEVLESEQVIECENGKGYVVIAAGAGTPDRTVPNYILQMIVEELMPVNLTVVWTGRNYERVGTNVEPRPEPKPLSTYRSMMVDLTDKLTVPGTAVLLQNARGLVTCHSALSILGWHLRKPQLLLYPDAVRQRHFLKKDQWSFGMDQPGTVHGTFEGFGVEQVREFIRRI